VFDDQQTSILNDLDAAHCSYYEAEVFGGPSLYFHLKSLEDARAQNFERFSERVYAVLCSWGMHRMGMGGSKMREFDDFKSSLLAIWPLAMQLQNKIPLNLNNSDWLDLKQIFCGIRCMASRTSLVGNSKVMTHLLPDLVPPVDREYTLRFLYRSGQITNDIEGEWKTLRQVLEGFFYPVSRSPVFQARAEVWLAQKNQVPMGYLPLENPRQFSDRLFKNGARPTQSSEVRVESERPAGDGGCRYRPARCFWSSSVLRKDAFADPSQLRQVDGVVV
jgi:hypothetical protein